MAPNLGQLKQARPQYQKTYGQKPLNLWLISEILVTPQPLSNATPLYFDKLLCTKSTFVMNCHDHDKITKKYYYPCSARRKWFPEPSC